MANNFLNGFFSYMVIIVLLLTSLMLAYFSRPRDKQSYNKTCLAIFGIAYFSVWHFIDFYFQIFPADTSVINFAFVSLVSISFLLSVLPWTRQVTQAGSYVFIGLFVVSIFITFVFDKNIKQLIAKQAGYYSQIAPAFPDFVKDRKSTQFQYDAGGFSITVPGTWNKKTNELGMVYFVKKQKDNKTAELRPSCFHNSELTLPEIVTNILKTAQRQNSEKNCSVTNLVKLTCLVTSRNITKTGSNERWRWLQMDKNTGQNIELDFVFNEAGLSDKQEAGAIIHSLQSIALDEPLPYCPRSAEWF